jgi:hypothetical protein
VRVWRAAGHMQSGVIANCLYKSLIVSLFLATYPIPTSSNTLLKHFEKRYTKNVCDVSQAVHCCYQGGPDFTHVSLCRIDGEKWHQDNFFFGYIDFFSSVLFQQVSVFIFVSSTTDAV